MSSDRQSGTKICFISPKSYPYFNGRIKGMMGGGERQISLLAKQVASDSDFRVEVCVADFGQNELEYHGNVRVRKALSFEQSKVVALYSLWRAMRSTRADVFVCRSGDAGIFFALLIAKVLLGKKFLYMVSSDGELSHKSLKKAIGNTGAMLMKLVYRFSDLVTVQTDHQLKQMMEIRKIPMTKIRKVPNIVKSVKNFTPHSRSSVLWIGRCVPLKRPELLIEYAQRFPSEKFTMICNPFPGLEDYFEKIRKEAKRFSNIEFYDYVPAEKMADFYLSAKVYILLSEYEGFSNSMLEAMRFRTPVLSLNVDPDGIITRFQAGYCTGGDLEEFLKRFKRLLVENSLCMEFGRNGESYVRSQHEPSEVASAFLDIVRFVLRK